MILHVILCQRYENIQGITYAFSVYETHVYISMPLIKVLLVECTCCDPDRRGDVEIQADEWAWTGTNAVTEWLIANVKLHFS